MRKEVYEAARTICPMCDETKCVGRSQCKQISEYLKSKLVDFNQLKKASAMYTLESPVELGQKVYTIPRSAIREWTVAGVWISADPKCSYVHIYWEKNGHHMGSCAVNFSDINRCLFLSREEAEQALGKVDGERREGE